MRTIRVVNAGMNIAEVRNSCASTWGEFQEENPDLFQGNVKGVVKETKISLDNEDALLPEGKLTGDDIEYEFTLFFVVKESKAGSDYESWDFQRLRREAAKLGLNNNGKSRFQLIREIRGEVASTPSTSSSQLNRIEEKIDQISEFIRSFDEEYDEDYNVPTEEDLEFYNTIRN